MRRFLRRRNYLLRLDRPLEIWASRREARDEGWLVT
jgi:hypothetical protein